MVSTITAIGWQLPKGGDFKAQSLSQLLNRHFDLLLLAVRYFIF